MKQFEQADNLLPNTWIVVRIDGRGFTKYDNRTSYILSSRGVSDRGPRFSAKYGFEKPNDKRALELMNAAARAVMAELPDITIAYGVSDEYRCVLH